MDDMSALERQLASELGQMAGRGRRIDAVAMVHSVTTTAPAGRWSVITRRLGVGPGPASAEGGFSMFSAVKFVAAAAVVALFGSFLLLASPSEQEPAPVAPAASSTPGQVEPTEPVETPRPTPEEWSGLEATDPRPEGQPNHPLMAVDFQEFKGVGPSDWRVWDMAREGMDLTPFNMAIGPDWDVWEHEQGACGDKMLGEEVACIWQVGVPGVEFLPEGTEFIDFAVGPDGLIWGVSQQGLVAFDGRDWFVHDYAAGREDDSSVAWDIAPDGSAWLLEEMRDDRLRLVHATTEGVEFVDTDGLFAAPISDFRFWLAIASDGSIWLSGEPAPCFPCPTHEPPIGFIARLDGQAWVQEDPLGDGSPMTGAGVASGPNGSLWALITTDDSTYLATLEDSGWSVFGVEQALPALEDGYPVVYGAWLVGSDGTAWFSASLGHQGRDLVSFDGETWNTHLLAGRDIRDAAAAPDGSVWVSLEDDGEGEGVYALRH